MNASRLAADDAGPHDWLPASRLWRYHLTLALGGGMMAAIFAGWMILQWSNPVMRWASAALIVLTAWITVAAIRADVRRTRGRRLQLEAQTMHLTCDGQTRSVPLAPIARGRWRDDRLTYLDDAGRVVVELDPGFIKDVREARAFVYWARSHNCLTCEVAWEQPDDV